MSSIEPAVSDWPGIEVAPHRFSAREFTLDGREVGHVHSGHLLDIPFTKRIRDVLIEKGRAQSHHIYPDSSWVSYRIHTDDDIKRALWLLRVSYLYHVITLRNRDGATPAVAAVDVESELAGLEMSDELRAILEDLLPQTQS